MVSPTLASNVPRAEEDSPPLIRLAGSSYFDGEHDHEDVESMSNNTPKQDDEREAESNRCVQADADDSDIGQPLPTCSHFPTSLSNVSVTLRRPHIANTVQTCSAPAPLLARAPYSPPLPYRARHPSANYRRQMLVNHMLLLDAAEHDGHGEAYEELKRLIIFAGIFFLFIIIFVLLKFQVSLDDVFKWSPVVWLIGVIICGLLMNLFIQLKKFLKRRRAKRLQEQQDLLYSLHLPTSFPCLAPPPHTEACCRCGGGIFSSPTSSPAVTPQQRYLQFRDALINRVNNNEHFNTSEIVELLSANVPSSSDGEHAGQMDEALIGLFASGLEHEAGHLPTYEQVMRGAKTWLLSKAALASSSNQENQSHPPAYSPLTVELEAGDSASTRRRAFSPLHVDIGEGGEQQFSDQPMPRGQGDLGDTPPPAYDETVSVEESARLMGPNLAQLDDIANVARPPRLRQRASVPFLATPAMDTVIVSVQTGEESPNSGSLSSQHLQPTHLTRANEANGRVIINDMHSAASTASPIIITAPQTFPADH